MLKADPLIRTKLHLPFTRPGLVARPQLQEQIAQGLHGPLTLVTAPAGFGKTPLVASCVAGCGMPVAWLSLDKNDNQPGRFLHYLVAALQAADPALGSEAAQCVEDASYLAGRDRGQTQEMITLAAARVMFARGEPEEAIAGLTRSLDAAEASGRLGAVIELRILRSLAFVRRGNCQEALADLERALTLAEPEGYVRIFIDEGQPMQLLLAQWQAHANAGPLRDYVTRLLNQFDAEPRTMTAAQEKSSPTGGLAEPLSQRELEVLHLIALGRTNQEIARQLVVAAGTIKAHTASIYRKLDVSNRTEAVARARELGLLP